MREVRLFTTQDTVEDTINDRQKEADSFFNQGSDKATEKVNQSGPLRSSLKKITAAV